MSKEVFTVDPFLGLTRELVHVDGDTFALTATQDVEPILDANKASHLFGNGYSPSRELRHRARVPAVIYELWKNVLGVDMLNPDHKGAVRRLLNSNEWASLRTSPGTI